MSQIYLTSDTDLKIVADAIRQKSQTTSSLIYPSGFATAIQNLPQPELFAPLITQDTDYFYYSNNTSNGDFTVTLTAELNGQVITTYPVPKDKTAEYNYLKVTASANGFKSNFSEASNAGLYHKDETTNTDTLLVSWEHSGIDNTCSNATGVLSNYPTCNKVIIGLNVVNINKDAFKSCENLTSVIISNKVKSIGEAAFYGCNITSLTIPNNVENIDASAFYSCSKLTSVTLSNNLNRIKPYTFYYCTSLQSITFPESVLYIDDKAFYCCTSLVNVIFSDNLTYIGSSAFSQCTAIKSINIPKKVSIIHTNPFSGCTSLESITVDPENTTYHSNSNCVIYTNIKSLLIGCKNSVIPSDGSVINIYFSAFYGCTGLESIIIPDTVVTILHCAFDGCTGLTSISIPNSTTYIGQHAFAGCIGLTSAMLGDSVESIDYCAFLGCTGLTSITIPDSVESIGDSVFASCTNLLYIILHDNLANIGSSAFYNTAWFNNQPDGVVYAGKVAYSYKGSLYELIEIILREDTIGIAGAAFSGQTAIKSITIPNSVKVIGIGAFMNCTGLYSINLPNNVTIIRNMTFSECIQLHKVVIGNAITDIQSSSFYGCQYLTSFTCNTITPPYLDSSALPAHLSADPYTIYVPAESVEAYKTADNWKTHADYIQAIS